MGEAGPAPDPSHVAGGDEVRAAGCVLWRRGGGGRVEIALVHRPKYDDWSHPKGKLDPGESWAEAARREVREETGMECVLGEALPEARYLARGHRKVVQYWVAEAVAGRFTRNNEVDEVRWLPPDRARATLTHPGNRDLLDRALAALDGTPAGEDRA
ncbi:NUDIX hydrolase [Streptomyces sp. DSM 44917]|uniref:NUDIX hydrolase n=1 Tax=Streptomyces boetiae TaxID=3075541 RepID=A0ABU2L1R8_9ACTN|nr:NUDIX hydrolase [Streptomyces sp. DSM 44917]MDT0305509.1 NUDIX hydrolase [Streptomyces sp. DSM 44917]